VVPFPVSLSSVMEPPIERYFSGLRHSHAASGIFRDFFLSGKPGRKMKLNTSMSDISASILLIRLSHMLHQIASSAGPCRRRNGGQYIASVVRATSVIFPSAGLPHAWPPAQARFRDRPNFVLYVKAFEGNRHIFIDLSLFADQNQSILSRIFCSFHGQTPIF
jgi:hypothetical protein